MKRFQILSLALTATVAVSTQAQATLILSKDAIQQKRLEGKHVWIQGVTFNFGDYSNEFDGLSVCNDGTRLRIPGKKVAVCEAPSNGEGGGFYFGTCSSNESQYQAFYSLSKPIHHLELQSTPEGGVPVACSVPRQPNGDCLEPVTEPTGVPVIITEGDNVGGEGDGKPVYNEDTVYNFPACQ